MTRIRTLVVIGAVCAAAAHTAAASATTFCVPDFHPACPNAGGNVAEANLEAAMTTNGADGQADTAIVDAGTFTDTDTFNPSGSDPLVIQGAGTGATTMTSSSSGNVYVVNLHAASTRLITMRDVTVEVPDSFPTGLGAALQVAGDTLEDVDIVSRNAGSSAIPSIIGSLTYRGGEIRGEAGGSIGVAIGADAAATAVVIDDLIVDRPVNAISQEGPTAAVTITRTQVLNPLQGGIVATVGTMKVENSVVVTDQGIPVYAFAVGANPVTIDVDHATIVFEAGNTAPLNATVGASASGNAAIAVSDSIISDFPFAYLRQVASGGTGDANLSIAHSNFDPANGTSSGSGTLDLSTANINADPLFTSATDFRLQAGSPSIDAGDPGAANPTTDFLGLPRPVDGDGDGSAVRDQGAYEFQPEVEPPAADTDPPETTLTKKPKRKTTKRKAKFGFEADEADSSFQCLLDKQEFAPCETPLKTKKLKRRKHKFLVRAIDAAGNADPTPAKAKFKVKRR